MSLYMGSNLMSLTSQNLSSTATPPQYAESLEWLNQHGDASLSYYLPDGYIYAKTTQTVADFTNVFDINQAKLNILAYGDNQATETTKHGEVSTGLIPISCSENSASPTLIRVRGTKMLNWNDATERVVYYNASKQQKWYCAIKTGKHEVADNGDLTIYAGWSTNAVVSGASTNYKYFSLSTYVNGVESDITEADIKDLIITINEPITYSEQSVWANTGVQYNSGGSSLTEDEIKEIISDNDSLKDKKILVLGDSISTDAYGNYKKWVSDLVDEGFFPSTITNNSQHATGFVARYTAENANAENSFVQRIQAVVDKNSYDYVIIFGGINDYIQHIEMGGETGKTDKATYFKPAVDWFFDYLIKNFVQARILIISPLRTYNVYKNLAGGSQATGYYQTDYADYIKQVAKSYCLPVLNLTEESGFYPFIDEFKAKWTLIPSGYTSADGVHPNVEWSKNFLAPMIKNFIKKYK